MAYGGWARWMDGSEKGVVRGWMDRVAAAADVEAVRRLQGKEAAAAAQEVARRRRRRRKLGLKPKN